MNAKAILGLVTVLGLTSCNHKDLFEEVNFGSHINVVFDWRYAPDGDPASMGLMMFDTDGANPINFNFQNKTGGTIRLPFSDYIAVCMNNDDTDWAVTESTDRIDDIKISTGDATVLQAAGLVSRALPRARDAEDERMAKTPGMLWTDRVDSISLPVTDKVHTITLYPEERICRYTVDIYDVTNISNLSGSEIDATISGMAEGFHPGREKTTETYATMAFILTPDEQTNSLHAEFLTFGETEAAEKPHTLSLYMITEDGNKWHYTADVTSQVSEAPDPRNVHIVIRGVNLPSKGDPITGGVTADVNDWQTVNIDLHM